MKKIELTDSKKEELFCPTPIIEKMIVSNSDLVHEIEEEYKIPDGYLIPHLAIHLPRFNKEELDKEKVASEGRRLAKELSKIYNSLGKRWRKLLVKKKRDTKIKFEDGEIYIADDDGNILKEVSFEKVPSDMGNFIQNKLHYIQKARSDTKFHLGFYSESEKIPFAYASFSILDRDYLEKGLPEKVPSEKVLVMTRAFGFNFIPHNGMSALFHCCYKFFRDHPENYDVIITALNPNLLFKGSIFKGASYFPFALSPLQLIYHKGNYVTRRFCREKFGTEDLAKLEAESKITRAKIKTKDILWLIRGLSSRKQENVRNIAHINKITEGEYLNG